MFIDRLINKIKEKNNPSVIGLDPMLELIPDCIKNKAYSEYGKTLKGAAEAVYLFNKGIIDSIYDLIPAVKPQIAFYEALSHYGMDVFNRTIKYAKEKGLIVISDAKRNDIGNTATAYSSAYLGRTKIEDELIKVYDADALTVNPYMGYDSIKPFYDDCVEYGKGIFILVKTSNKSSGDLQDIICEDGRSIFEKTAVMVDSWGSNLIGEHGYSSIGAVVGATYPSQGILLREIMKKAYILVPGYGAQGGSALDTVGCFNPDGLGAIVNASRSVLYAYRNDKYCTKYNEDQYGEAARQEVIRMKDDLNNALQRKFG